MRAHQLLRGNKHVGRLKTLKPRLQGLPDRLQSLPRTATRRAVTGRQLQQRRLSVWTKAEGCCARCGCLMAWPNGFELDHVVPLFKGGQDTEENTQILCIENGCHASKTREDLAARG
ncbi:HNH endonuclease [Lysobacter tyrosinilyticus]